VEDFMETWQQLASEHGLPGFYFIAMANSTNTISRKSDGGVAQGRVIPDIKSSAKVYNDILALGFDGINSFGKSRA
jgi:hypothetical protein